MKQTHSKGNEKKLQIENLDDLWYLSQVIEPGDIISGTTLRKLKIGDGENVKVIRKPVFMQIKVEKIDFSKEGQQLRATGTIMRGPEDVSIGSYHTFALEERSEFKIEKQQWLKFQRDKIKEAIEGKASKILLVIFDREEAHFAMLKTYGYEYLSKIKGEVSKKAFDGQSKGNFYKDIITQVMDYDKRYDLHKIVIGSPAFWKEHLMKEVKDDNFKKKILLATTSTVDRKGFDELLRRDEVQQALKQERIAKEVEVVEELLTRIAADGNCAYGFKSVVDAANAGAVDMLMVTDSKIWQSREDGNYGELEKAMRITDSSQGNIIIISHEHDGGKKLEGLGGVGALLRFKIA